MGDSRNVLTIPLVREFLLNPDGVEQLEQVQERHGLPVERAIEHLTLTRAVLDGLITLDHMPALLAEAFGVDEAEATKLACDVAGVRLLPLEEYFPGVAAQIEAWGGSVVDYPAFRVGKEKITADHYAGRLTEKLSLTLQPNHIKRLGFLVKSYLAGEKNKDSLLTFFARPVTIGGLGLSNDAAQSVFTAVEAERHMIDLVDDEKLETFAVDSIDTPVQEADGAKDELANQADTATDPLAAPSAPAAFVATLASEQIDDAPPVSTSEQPEDPVYLPEIAPSHNVATETPMAARPPERVVAPQVSMLTPPPATTAAAKKGDTETMDGIASDIAREQKKIVKKDIAVMKSDDRLAAALAAATAAAESTLTACKMSKDVFADIATLAIKGVRDPYQTRTLLEREHGVSGENLLQLLEAMMQGMDVWHAAAPAVETPPSVVPADAAVVTREQQLLDKRFAATTQTMPQQAVEPVLPSARVSAARTKQEEVAVQTAKVDPAKLEAAAEASRPQPAKAMLTVGSLPPPSPGEQRVVADVQYRSRLVGPVEELGTMTPADFRRLSSQPAAAVQKIEDILSNLETTSYDERIRGVQAWRSSPVNALYVAMANEALSGGISLAEVASRRRGKGEESLSPAEMKAIGMLNEKIRF